MCYGIVAVTGSGLAATLEKLDLPFVLHGFLPCFKRPQVAAFAGFWIFLARVKPVTAVFKFTDHVGFFLQVLILICRYMLCFLHGDDFITIDFIKLTIRERSIIQFQ